MKRATPATDKYTARFRQLIAEGLTLRNYGGGWRYFTRPVAGAPKAPPPNSPDGAEATWTLYEACRVNEAGTVVEQLEQQYING